MYHILLKSSISIRQHAIRYLDNNICKETFSNKYIDFRIFNWLKIKQKASGILNKTKYNSNILRFFTVQINLFFCFGFWI
jgi:hypothetical protein